MSQNAVFCHAGCAVCLDAEQRLAGALGTGHYDVEINHLGETRDRIAEADRAGVKSVPAQQGFARGRNILGLQFHPEVDACAGIVPWLVGHAAELAGAGIDRRTLRDAAALVGPELRAAARKTLTEWLQGVPA